ncbi:AsnC family protein [Nonomuraea sp. NPDC050790]|uniref:AsnC family protein n=1 Tax=Nonomuraea sp. NPDC050790 TaxID=3364371 RepID=UPI003790AF04
METGMADELDRRLIHALQLDARAPFSRIAEVLGASDQTVARRYRRLRSADLLRVVAVPPANLYGHGRWMLRLRCVPGAANAIASAPARRPDTAWVQFFWNVCPAMDVWWTSPPTRCCTPCMAHPDAFGCSTPSLRRRQADSARDPTR